MTMRTRESPELFVDQSVEILGRFRAAVAAAIAAIPGTIARPVDLQRATKLDSRLSWRLFRLAEAPNPVVVGLHAPASPAIRSFVRAAARAGVAEEVLRPVEAASRELEEFIRGSAGDRSAFQSMVSALTPNDETHKAHLVQRRNAYRANRHIWGVQAGTRVKCMFAKMGSDPTKVHLAIVDGYVGLRALRPGTRLLLTEGGVGDDQGRPLPLNRHPIDPGQSTEHGHGLLSEFCSRPSPELRDFHQAAGFICSELVTEDIGKRSEITYFRGWHADNAVNRHRSPDDLCLYVNTMVRVPCEGVLACALVSRGLFGSAKPKLAVYSDHRAELPYPSRLDPLDELLLPDEAVVYRGRGATALPMSNIPRLAEMAEYVFSRLGWDGSQFDVHTCRVAYPVVPSTVSIITELPEA